jgi:hypothetical protein
MENQNNQPDQSNNPDLDKFLDHIGSFQKREVNEEEMLLLDARSVLTVDETEEQKLESYLDGVRQSMSTFNNIRSEEGKVLGLAMLVISGICECMGSLEYMAKMNEFYGGEKEIPEHIFQAMYADFKNTQKLLMDKISAHDNNEN